MYTPVTRIFTHLPNYSLPPAALPFMLSDIEYPAAQ